MSNENLPREQGFMDRVRRAFYALSGKDPSLEAREEALKRREEALDRREEALDRREERIKAESQRQEKSAQKLQQWSVNLSEKERRLAEREAGQDKQDAILETARNQAGLYAEQKGISPEMPDVKVHAYKCVTNRIEELYMSFIEIKDKIQTLKGVECNPQDREKILQEYAKLKGKLLGEMAIFREIMSPEEITTTIIGDKGVTVGSVAQSLPRILGIVQTDQRGGEFCFVSDSPELSKMSPEEYKKQRGREKKWVQGFYESYFDGLKDLYDIGFIENGEHDFPDFTEKLPMTSKNVAWLMNQYYKINFSNKELSRSIGEVRKEKPFRGLRKIIANRELTISGSPIVGELMELVEDMREQIGEMEYE